MAIRINLESQEACQRAYLNYHCYGNSLNISDEVMGAIISRWQDRIPSWQATACSNDENEYKFDDSEFENIKTESYSNTEEQYGDDVNTKGAKARANADIGSTITAGALGAAGAAKGAADLGLLSGKIGDKIAKIGSGKEIAKVGANSTKAGAGSGGSVGSWVGFIISIVSCITTYAIGLNAKRNIANKEEHAAVVQLQEEMGTKQQELTTKAGEILDYEEEIVTLTDEAQQENENCAQVIEGEKTTYDMSNRVYLNLSAKINRGESLTSGEMFLYNKSLGILNTTSGNIDSTIAASSDIIQTKGAEIQAFQGKYDMVASNIAEVQGFTDYAAEIDEITQKSCEKEQKAQSSNFTMGLVAAGGMALSTVALAAQYATPATFWMSIIIGVVGAACAVFATIGAFHSKEAAVQQGEMAAQVSEEVIIRQSTQDMAVDTKSAYDESVDNFAGTLDYVQNGLEVIKPDGTETPANAPKAKLVKSEDDVLK